MDSNDYDIINLNFTSKTFLAYFGFFPNVFFGNVGRYDQIFFPERPEMFNMEDCIEENLFNNNNNSNNSNNSNSNCVNAAKNNNNVMEKKMARFKKHEIANLKVYKVKLQKLLYTYNHLLEVIEKNNKIKKNVADLFQKFFAELQTLQENYKYQRDSIIRSHMIDIFGHFEDADEKPFDLSNLIFFDLI
jgi:hypothetical protein